MYLRFVSPLRSCVRDVNLGIFQCACEYRDNNEYPDFLRTAIREELEWFNEHLPCPETQFFGVKSRKRLVSVGICWFKCDAHEMISHAFALRTFLGECGVGIATFGTHNPGQILYTDDFQIIAKPFAATPTKWG